MKLHKLLLLAALGAVMTGCQKEAASEGTEPDATGIPITITAGVDPGVDTRIGYEEPDENNKKAFQWTPGDKISLLTQLPGRYVNTEFATESNQKTGVFKGIQPTGMLPNAAMAAVFPYNSVIGVTGDLFKIRVTLDLPTTQTYTIGGNLSNSYMVAFAMLVVYEVPALTFKPQNSIIQVDITGVPTGKKVTKVDLSAASAIFSSQITVSQTTKYYYNPVSSLATNVVGSQTGTDTRVEMAIFPESKGNTMAGKEFSITVTVTDADGTSNPETKTITKTAPAFAAGTHYGIKFQFAAPAPQTGDFYTVHS